MTAVPCQWRSIDSAQLLNKQLSQASQDLMRDLLTRLVNALLSAQAGAVCGAGYGERTEERMNSRNGYRPRDLGTRVGTWTSRSPRSGRAACIPTGCRSVASVPSGP